MTIRSYLLRLAVRYVGVWTAIYLLIWAATWILGDATPVPDLEYWLWLLLVMYSFGISFDSTFQKLWKERKRTAPSDVSATKDLPVYKEDGRTLEDPHVAKIVNDTWRTGKTIFRGFDADGNVVEENQD